MLLARIVRHFKCYNLIIEARAKNGHKRIFFACRHSSEIHDLVYWVFAYDNLHAAESCLFEFDDYPASLHKETTDGAEIIRFTEKFERVSSLPSPPEWVRVSDSPFLEKCFALAVIHKETLSEC